MNVKKIFRTVCLGAVAAGFVACASEEIVTVDFPFRDCSFGLMYESVSGNENTTTVKLERAYSFTDGDFLAVMKPYKNEPNIALEITDKKFRVARNVGDASRIEDVLLTASVEGEEIARWGVESLEFSQATTDDAYGEFIDAFFDATVGERRTVDVVFTGTLIDYTVPEADREKVLVTYDFLQLMLARITIER